MKVYNLHKVLATNPTHIASVLGIEFFEHPVLGEYAPLIAIYGDFCVLSDEWDVPNEDCAEELMKDMLILEKEFIL